MDRISDPLDIARESLCRIIRIPAEPRVRNRRLSSPCFSRVDFQLAAEKKRPTRHPPCLRDEFISNIGRVSTVSSGNPAFKPKKTRREREREYRDFWNRRVASTVSRLRTIRSRMSRERETVKARGRFVLDGGAAFVRHSNISEGVQVAEEGGGGSGITY